MRVDEFVGLNISTVGFDSEVVRHSSAFPLQGLSYLSRFIHRARYSSPDIRVSIDGELSYRPTLPGCRRQRLPTVAACACCPIPEGRALDILVLDSVKVPKDYFSLLPRIIRGTYKKTNRKEIHTLRARSIVIESDTPLTLNLDGTLFDGRNDFHGGVIPAALRTLMAGV